MSQHINSMLEHLRVGPLKRSKATTDSDNSSSAQMDQTQQQIEKKPEQSSSTIDLINRGNGSLPTNITTDEVDNKRVSVVISDTRKKSLKEMPNGVTNLIECEKMFDLRKRYSISNGDIRSNGRSRELSPAPRMYQQRKLSADMRFRGSNNQLSDDYLMRRPVRLKSISTNFEVYDSLHSKAIDVSVSIQFKSMILNIRFI